ncbi:MAG: hypothetical protein NTX87_14735 [Planctomycetota bacterium]|nr:hypothetical protein [Planctomycetota bacterium]
MVDHGVLGGSHKAALDVLDPLGQSGEDGAGGGFVAAARRHFTDDAGAVAVLRGERLGLDDEPLRAGFARGHLCRSRLALGVLPAGELLALAGKGFRARGQRFGECLAVHGSHTSPAFPSDFDSEVRGELVCQVQVQRLLAPRKLHQ